MSEYSWGENVSSHSHFWGEKLHALRTSHSEIACSQTDASFAGHRSHQVIFWLLFFFLLFLLCLFCLFCFVCFVIKLGNNIHPLNKAPITYFWFWFSDLSPPENWSFEYALKCTHHYVLFHNVITWGRECWNWQFQRKVGFRRWWLSNRVQILFAPTDSHTREVF